MSGFEVMWRDETMIAVRVGDVVRRYSYVRRGSELLLTDGYGYWKIASAGAGSRARPEAGGAPGGPAASGRITAHMPGKVLDVRVAQGDSVAEGDVLLVLEAMKMEHAMTAPIAGVVKQLAVVPAQRVMPGELLLEIEPA